VVDGVQFAFELKYCFVSGQKGAFWDMLEIFENSSWEFLFAITNWGM
jgi:hypothetical protein